MAKQGEQVTIQFTTFGGAASADSINGVLIRNGVDTAESVTITNLDTGRYRAQFTVPASYSEDDEVQVRIAAIKGTSTVQAIIWSDVITIDLEVSGIQVESATFTGSGSYYGSVVDADLYFSTERLNSSDWDRTSQEDKLKAIKQASRLIDRLRFIGDKTDEDQELEFPRDDETTIPRDITIACYEIAYALISGRDVEYEAEQTGDEAAIIGPGRLTVDPDTVNLAKIHSIPSVVAWRHIWPYLVPGDSVILSRVD